MGDDDRLALLPLYLDPDLIDCGCFSMLPWRKNFTHTRSCLKWRAERFREKELAQALKLEDIRWLADHGWDGRFAV